MARKNIFQIISEKYNNEQEINRLEALIHNAKGVAVYNNIILGVSFDNVSPDYMTIEDFVDQYAFKQWKFRGTCIDLKDMTTVLGIEDMFASEHYTEEQLLIYLEYIANILHLLNQVECTPDWSYTKTDIVTATQQNLTSFLDWLNYEAKTFNKQGRVLIVHKNAPATAVAEIVEADLAYQIIQYNHHTLQGDIEAKKTILLALGSELEPKRKLMEARNKTLTDGIFFMLNNLNLRHNNRSKKDKNYKEAVANMRKNKLEQWYDELYQMMLLAFLELEQSDRELKITELKQLVTGGNK